MIWKKTQRFSQFQKRKKESHYISYKRAVERKFQHRISGNHILGKLNDFQKTAFGRLFV